LDFFLRRWLNGGRLLFTIIVGLVAVLAGGIASIAGFGIGSLLTPLVASEYRMKTAVGAVAILCWFSVKWRAGSPW